MSKYWGNNLISKSHGVLYFRMHIIDWKHIFFVRNIGSGFHHPYAGISETLKKVSVSTTFDLSRLVSLSTTPKMPSLKESWYQQHEIF
jgi:hypothetical protein